MPALSLALAVSSLMVRSLRQLDHRNTRRGLRPHCPREGTQLPSRLHLARAPQLVDGNRHDPWDQPRLLNRWNHDRRDDLLDPLGIGKLIVEAILSRDYPVIQGVTLVIGVLVLIVNLCTDLTYVVLDPRVKFE